MKIALVLLFVMVAVTVDAMDLNRERIRRESELDLDEAGGDAGGYGEDVAAQTAVITQQDKDGNGSARSYGAASAKKGSVSASSYMGHAAIRNYDDKPKEPSQELEAPEED